MEISGVYFCSTGYDGVKLFGGRFRDQSSGAVAEFPLVKLSRVSFGVSSVRPSKKEYPYLVSE